jgi:hypothetical protein
MNKQERELTSQLLDQLRHQAQTTTEFAARLAGQLVNDTLEVWTGVIPAEGYITRSYHVTAGSIEVSNWGTAINFMTAHTGGPAGAVPTGTGSYAIAGGASRTVALASREFTIWGTAGDRVSFQVFTTGVSAVTT